MKDGFLALQKIPLRGILTLIGRWLLGVVVLVALSAVGLVLEEVWGIQQEHVLFGGLGVICLALAAIAILQSRCSAQDDEAEGRS